MNTMPERLKHLRTRLGLTQSDFAAKIGLKSGSAVHLMESGTRRITDRTLKMICSEFRVNADWIKNGTPPIFTSERTDRGSKSSATDDFAQKIYGEARDDSPVSAGGIEGMGQAVEMLAHIYHSRNQEIIRAIQATLHVCCVAVQQAARIDRLTHDMDNLRRLFQEHARLHAYHGEDRRSGVERRHVEGVGPGGIERRSGVDRRRAHADNGDGI